MKGKWSSVIKESNAPLVSLAQQQCSRVINYSNEHVTDVRTEIMDCYQCILLQWFLYVPGNNSWESWSLYEVDSESLSEIKTCWKEVGGREKIF